MPGSTTIGLKISACILRVLIPVAFFMLSGFPALATHNRAGEITMEFLGPLPALKYRATIITYTKTSSFAADRPSLDSVYWGDGAIDIFYRAQKIDLGNDISKNIYYGEHTYSGNGVFIIHFEDPNRNEGVINIPNSIDVPFYVETELIINPYNGAPDNSPVLNYPPIDRGCVGRTFIHNPAAYDPDGDSLSYELTVCRGAGGLPIPGYTFPATSGTFSINAVTGDLIWDTPLQAGEYNVAFHIYEWRKGHPIGYITRDMQILIGNCNNRPPEIFTVNDTCVIAGDTLRFNVTAIDPDQNNVVLSGYGGPFEIPDSAVLVPVQQNNDTVVSEFNWATACNHIRSQPYYAQFRAKDIVPQDSISLVDLGGTFIRVIGPPPQNTAAVANNNSITVSWDPPYCANAIGYRIYRRVGLYTGVIECPCDNGAPSYSGYSLLDIIPGISNTTYTDNNHGTGLVIGIEYCYIVTAVYPDSSESCASPQVCESLKKDLPVITNVDVLTTSQTSGQIYIAWSKPTELDTIQFPGPYEYRIFHSTGFTGAGFVQFHTYFDLNDTLIMDSLMDTQTQPWSYRVDLYYNDSGTPALKGSTTLASSVFLSISPTDNRLNLSWQEFVPWSNNRYDIFRQNPLTSLFDSIGTTTLSTFTDSGLANGTSYCYFIRSSGSYFIPGVIDPIVNRSQIACGTPLDNVPPCAPPLAVTSFCLDDLNKLVWSNPNHSCSDDVLKYYIYYAPEQSSAFERIDSVLSPDDTVYYHRNLSNLSGCYKVTGVDSVGNETVNAPAVCVDTCRLYVLPSVFTPDHDGKNDLFHPCDSTTAPELQLTNCPPYKNVKQVEMKIYNRWGNLEFETTDKNINWDGKNKESGKDCPEGVYFYTCRVYFYRIRGEEALDLNGYIHLIRTPE